MLTSLVLDVLDLIGLSRRVEIFDKLLGVADI